MAAHSLATAIGAAGDLAAEFDSVGNPARTLATGILADVLMSEAAEDTEFGVCRVTAELAARLEEARRKL